MRNFKRFLAMALTMLMVIGCVSLSAFAFEDYADGDYTAAVENLADKGIIYGVSETEFDPESPVLRWQAALFLARMASGLTSAQDQAKIWYTETNTTDFTDVEPHQYIGAIQYAANFNFIVGNGDGTYNPDGQIILQDMLTMAVRALGYDVDLITGEPFGSAGYPWKYISAAVKLGLDKGLEDVAYTAPLTRAQTAQLINNLFYTKSITGHSYAIDVFGDYSQEELNTTVVVVATETTRLNGAYAAEGKVVVNLGAGNVTVDAALLPAGVVAGDSFGAYVVDDEIKYCANVNASTLTTLYASDKNNGDTVKDADGNVIPGHQVLIGSTAYNIVSDPSEDGIVLYKVSSGISNNDTSITLEPVPAISEGGWAVFGVGGNWGQKHYVRAFDDDGDGKLDRGYIYGEVTGTMKAWVADFNRPADGTTRYYMPATSFDKYVRNFTNYRNMSTSASMTEGTYVVGFFDPFTETFFYTEAVTPGTYTVTGVLTEISTANHSVTVGGKKYTVGTTYDGPCKYESVLAACHNLSETLLNMTVRLVINEDEDCVIAIETEEASGRAFVIISVPTAEQIDEAGGKVVVKAYAYKATVPTDIEVVAVDGVYGAVPAVDTFYAGYKDFNGKWMLYSDGGKVFSLTGANTNLNYTLNFAWGNPFLAPGVTFIPYGIYVADENTTFQIWNGTEMFTFKGTPTFDATITACGANARIFWEYEEVNYHGQPMGNGSNTHNGILEGTDDDDETYSYRNILKNVYVWNGEFSGSYTDPNGKVVTPSAVEYDDIILIQSTEAGNAVLSKAIVTTNPDELAAAQAVVGGTVSKVTKWSNVYSVLQGKFITVTTVNNDTLPTPVADEHVAPKFYYVKGGVVIGECELGSDMVDAKVLKTSHVTSYLLIQRTDLSTEVITVNGALDGHYYMNWYGGMETDFGAPNLKSRHNCTEYYWGAAADCSDATAANTTTYPSAYVYVGPLSAEPIVIFHNDTPLA